MIAGTQESPFAEQPVETEASYSVAGSFDTIETAETLLERLRNQGIDACLSLVGGLSVVARYGRSGSYRTLSANGHD